VKLLHRPAASSGGASPPTTPRDGLLARIGRAAASRPRRVLAVWTLVVLGAAPLAVTLTSALSGAGWEAQGSTAQEVRDELRREFPELGAEAAIVAYRQPEPVQEDPAGLQRLVDALTGSTGAQAVVDPLTQPAAAGLVSRDGRAALIPVSLDAPSDAELPERAGDLMRSVAGGHHRRVGRVA
jgi:RND superfamily putative drug exporter